MYRLSDWQHFLHDSTDAFCKHNKTKRALFAFGDTQAVYLQVLVESHMAE